MKNLFFLPIFAIGLLLTGLGFSQVAIAQSSQDDLIESIDEIPFEEGEIQDEESDPAVEERNLRKEFRGIELTPEEFDRVRQARRQFRQELTEVMQQDFGSILQLVFLPQSEAEERSGKVLGNPIANYGRAISQVLTPEEIKIWQRNMEEDAQKAREEDD